MHALAQWSVHSKAGAHIDILKSGIKQTHVSEAIVQVEKKKNVYIIISSKQRLFAL